MQVIVNKAGTDCVSDVISQCLSWSSTKYVPCNLSTCKELVLKKKEISSVTRNDFSGQWQIYKTH